MPSSSIFDTLVREAVDLVAIHGSPHFASIASGIPKSTIADRCRMAARQGVVLEATAPPAVSAKKVQTSDRLGRTHMVIPDVQAKPGVPLEHLSWAGQYIAEKRPDVVVCIGDFADMESLSSYDRGKRSAENRRYVEDIESARQAMELLMAPIKATEGYSPRLVMTLGNHEDRISRYANDNPAMHEAVGVGDLGYEEWGWEVHPFLDVVKIDSIAYSHYFYVPNTGRPHGGTAHAKLKAVGMSFTMGHQQGLDIAMRELADGSRQIGLVAGSFYQHREAYRGPQANGHWHGLVLKNEVLEGAYDLSLTSLESLRKRYSK